VEIEAYEKLLANEPPTPVRSLAGESAQGFASAKKARLQVVPDCLVVGVPASRKLGRQDNVIKDGLEKRSHF